MHPLRRSRPLRRAAAALGIVALVAILVVPVAFLQHYHAHRAPPRSGPAALEAVPSQVGTPRPAPTRDVRPRVRRAARQQRARPASRFVWPVGGRWAITSPFGPRGDGDFHHGADIGCLLGDPIRAAFPGRVRFAGDGGAYGTTVVLDHGGSWMTLYGHLDEMAVRQGQMVEQRAVLGACGSTGYSTGPHLHFEIRYRGYVWDPTDYLP